MNKVALVSGGARGIGRAVADLLLARGWSVVATGVSDEEVAASPPAENLTLAQLDVTDQEGVDRLVSGLERLDALVNCAGVNKRLDEYDLAVFEQVIAINLTGSMRMCMACHPFLKASGGAIVNIASMFTFFGAPLSPGYAASKGGVAQLTKSLAVRWADDGIRVNAVAPGWIETAMTRPLLQDTARVAAILARTPQKRWGKPEDVARVIGLLLSDDTIFMTGTVVPVDGGYSIT
jgi:NAD(P)-dependent dehydrogenase (short-subunit alcohol dehydrogenase family)